MPTYDYECTKCSHTFDAFQSMSDEPLRKCPSCGRNTLRRLIGGGLGVIFKGSGFYVTDSKSTGSGKAAKKASDSGTADTPAKTSSDTPAASTTSSDTSSTKSTKTETSNVAG
ncbi:MAG: zinc ribbon domain-containing protein [Spirochaetaceae bacterium]|nr:MAG: zinc ribbon domain-containing protein [Spirochaetaceae bacterium]